MSGAHAKWTPERRAKAAELMRQRNRDPEFIAKRSAWTRDPERKAELRERGRKLAHANANDIVVNSTWLAGCYRAANRPQKRKKSSHTMKATMSRPEMRALASHYGKTVDHQENARKGWLTRRRKKIEAAIAERRSAMPRVAP